MISLLPAARSWLVKPDLDKNKNRISFHPACRKGTPKSLQPNADMDLTGECVATSIADLALSNP